MQAFYFKISGKMKFQTLLFTLAMAALASCGNSSLTRTLPNVSGTAGEVLVVMNKALWDGGVGEATREQLGAMLIGLPQPEPAFTLLYVNPEGFRDIYISHRNIVMVEEKSDLAEPSVTYVRNKWAETQLVITVAGSDTAPLAECIRENGEAIRRSINGAERERLTAWLTESAGTERSVLTQGDRHWELVLPAGYRTDFNREGIMMISDETPSTTQSIIASVTDRAYSQIGCIELADLTQKVTSAEIKGPDGGSFMVIEQKVPVSCRSFSLNGTDYIEMRGLWTLEGGFMGGPFISYAFIDPATSHAVVVTGFVYAPREKKRELLRQVEALMYTLQKSD